LAIAEAALASMVNQKARAGLDLQQALEYRKDHPSLAEQWQVSRTWMALLKDL